MQAVIDFVLAHQLVLAAAVVGVLDLVFALNKDAEANGVLHYLYLLGKKVLGKS